MTEEERAAFQAAALARLRNPPERVVPDRLFVEAAVELRIQAATTTPSTTARSPDSPPHEPDRPRSLCVRLATPLRRISATAQTLPRAVSDCLQEYDVLQRLTQQDYNELMDEVVAGTVGRMADERRAELHAGDLELIQQRVGVGVDACIARYEQAQQPLRFVRGDRVVCNIGGDCPWASGSIQARHSSETLPRLFRGPSDETARWASERAREVE